VLAKHFGTAGLEGFGFADDAPTHRRSAPPGPSSIIWPRRRKARWPTVDRLTPYRTSGTLEIDQASRRSLEITRTIREARREGSLLWVLDRTVTAMGSRLLAQWVANPLTDVAAIRARLEAVGQLVGDQPLCGDLHESLRRVVRRRAVAGPRDHRPGESARLEYSWAGRSVGCRPSKEKLQTSAAGVAQQEPRPPRMAELEAAIDPCPELRATLEAALSDECPLAAGEGGFIRDGFSAELDALRELAHGGKAVDRRLPGPREPADGHPQPEGRLQQGFWLLHRNHQRPPRENPARLHPQADDQERRTLHHAGTEGI